eukprot:SAG22_NODE_9149_length_607_cov_1.086614_1_plen_54_part_10
MVPRPCCAELARRRAGALRSQIYALYKQGTEGDVTGGQPYAIQMEKRAKWDAWN